MSLGYRNTAKALRRIDGFLNGTDNEQDLLERIAGVLRIDSKYLMQRVSEDIERHQLEEYNAMLVKAQAEFRPHIFVQTERNVPSPIFVAVITGSPYMRFILVESGDMTNEQIGEVIRRHYASCRGSIITFGRITGYRYQKSFDKGAMFDIEGNFLKTYEQAAIQPPHLSLSYKGREIPSSVFGNVQKQISFPKDS